MTSYSTPAAERLRKPWWRSKVLWFNAACAGLAAAEAGTNLLQPLLPVNAYGAIAFALSVGNAALRVLTTQGLAAGKDAQ